MKKLTLIIVAVVAGLAISNFAAEGAFLQNNDPYVMAACAYAPSPAAVVFKTPEDVGNAIRFSWEPVEGATYSLTIKEAGRETTIYSSPNLSTNIAEIPKSYFTISKQYIIYMEARKWQGTNLEQLWGNMSFIYGITQLPPSLSSPVLGNAESDTNDVTWRWNTVAGASSYQIEISDKNDFRSITHSQTTSGQQFTLDKSRFTPGTPYYARVKAIKGTNQSAWSNFTQFTLPTTTSLSAPSLSSPAIDTSNVNLNWNPVSGAISYEIQVSQYSDFYSYQTYTASSNSYSLPKSGFSPGTTYYTRVRAVNGANRSEWSSSKNFTLPQTTSPEQNLKNQIYHEFNVKIDDSQYQFDISHLRIIYNTLSTLYPLGFKDTVKTIEAYKPDGKRWAYANSAGEIGFYLYYDLDYWWPRALAHEIGHLVHFGHVKGLSVRRSEFRTLHNASSSLDDFARQYGMEHWMEDFATLFEAYMWDSSNIVQYARIRAKQDPQQILLQKLSMVIEVFRNGNEIYTYRHTGMGNYEVRKLSLGPDGLPVF